jgi:hypothetical protein
MTGWDQDLLAELYPTWLSGGYMADSLMEVEHLVGVIDGIVGFGASVSIASVTAAPRGPQPSRTKEQP